MLKNGLWIGVLFKSVPSEFGFFDVSIVSYSFGGWLMEAKELREFEFLFPALILKNCILFDRRSFLFLIFSLFVVFPFFSVFLCLFFLNLGKS